MSRPPAERHPDVLLESYVKLPGSFQDPAPFPVLRCTERRSRRHPGAALAHRHVFLTEIAFDGFGTCLPNPCFSSRGRKFKIVVSSGIRSLISSMPANRRIGGHLGQSLLHSGIAERTPLLQQVYLNIAAGGHGGRPPFLLVLRYWGSNNAISACQGTIASISESNF